MRAKWVLFGLIGAVTAAVVAAPREVAAQPVADCTFAAPAEALLGSTTTATVSIRNTGTAPGFVPVIDLRVPSTVTILSAQVAGASATVLGPFPLSTTPVAHPVTGLPITGTAGTSLVTVRLPLSSMAAGLGALTTSIDLRTTAPTDTPVTLQATCGFAYGTDAVNNPGSDAPRYDPVPPAAQQVTARVITVATHVTQPRVCQGPGESTTQIIDVDLAEGVTVGPLSVSDVLSDRFDVDTVVVSGGGVVTQPSGAGGTVRVDYGAVTGVAGVDFTIAVTGHVIVGTVTHANPVAVAVSNSVRVHGLGPVNTLIPYVRSGASSTTLALSSAAAVTAHALRIDETLAGSPGRPGDPVRASLAVCVADDFTFTGATLASVLPDGTSYLGNPSGGTPTVVGSDPTTVTFALGALAAGTHRTFAYDTTIDQAYVNSAPVLGGDQLPTVHTLAATVQGGGAFSTTEALSGADVSYAVVTPGISTTVVAVNGILAGPSARFKADDVVTYEVQLTLSSGDQGALTLDAFFPPVFSAVEHGASGTVGATGPIKVGPAHNAAGSISWTATAAENRLRFAVPAVTDPTPRIVQLRIDLTVNHAPAEDGLVLTEVAQFSTLSSSGAAVTGLAFTGNTLEAPQLTAGMVPASVTDVDAGDQVTLQLRVSNVGHSSAFGVTLRQELPTALVASGTVTVQDAAGTTLAATGDLFAATGLTLTAPLPAGPGDTSTAVITFQVDLGVVAANDTLTTTGRVLGYANAPVGGSYPEVTAATVLHTSSLAVSTPLPVAPTAATIGQAVPHQVVLTVPEGVTPGASLAITLDPELVIDGNVTVTMSPGVTVTSTGPASPTGSFTIPLGTITNTNRVNAAIETLTVSYAVRPANDPQVQDDDDSVNTEARLTWPVNASVVVQESQLLDVEEPGLQLAVTSSPPTSQGGDVVSWTATVTAAPGAAVTAYDVRAEPGTVPTSLTILSITVTGVGAADHADGAARVWDAQAIGETATITVTAELTDEAPVGGSIALPLRLSWTSRPGDQAPRERTGAGGVNDYLVTATAAVGVVGVGTFGNTRLTVSTRFTIGTDSDYQLSLVLPKGTINELVFTHDLPVELDRVSEPSLDAHGALCETSSGFVACTDAHIPTPTVVGRSYSWNFGRVRNPHGNNDAAAFSFVSRARVANVATAVAGARLSTSAHATGTPVVQSGELLVHEPQVVATAAALPTVGVDGGDSITLSGTLRNPVPLPPTEDTVSVAHDVVVSYAAQSAGLVLDSASSPDCPGVFTASLAAATVSFSSIPFAGTCSYQIVAHLADDIPANSTLQAGPRVTWTSLEGDMAAIERTGAGGINDYFVVVPATALTTRGGSLALSVASVDEDPASPPPALFAGERLIYDLAITVPDGVSPSSSLRLVPPPGLRLVSAVLDLSGFAGAVAPLDTSALPRSSGLALTLPLATVTATSGPGQVDNVFHVRVEAAGTFDSRNRLTPTGQFSASLSIGGAVQGGAQTQPVELVLPRPELVLSASRIDAGVGAAFDLTATVSNLAAVTSAPLCDSLVTLRLPGDYQAAPPGSDGLDNDGDAETDEADEASLVVAPAILAPLRGCLAGGTRALRFHLTVGGAAPLPHANVTATLGSYYTLASSNPHRELVSPVADGFDNNRDGQRDEVGDAIATLGLRPDTDTDGTSDADEHAQGSNPGDADSDDDGVLDGAEPQAALDGDGDGVINALDPDSDNDGLFDGTELGVAVAQPRDTDLTARVYVPDLDPATTTDPLQRDSDGGGVRDGSEDGNHNGRLDAGETNPNLGADDGGVIDGDGDGLSNAEELALGTSPIDNDSDDDGVGDGAEPNYTSDADGDGLVQPLDADSDNDGLADGTEAGVTAALTGTDVEAGRFVIDLDPATTTGLLRADTDRGGVRDGEEDLNRNGRVDAGERDPRVRGDDGLLIDFDGDGWSDDLERAVGSDPLDPDSDDDGVLDGQEPNGAIDGDGDGLRGVLDPDSDDDGLFDGTELGVSLPQPRGTDLAAGHYRADADPSTRTNPLRADSDGGGVRDGAEDDNRDGAVDPGERDPRLASDDGAVVDGDSDGLSDRLEAALGTSPTDADTDDDGLLDGREPNFALDGDGDGAINALDPDSDNDGLYDGTERGVFIAEPATNVSRGVFIADANPATRTKMIVADTDRGGVGDGTEDTSKNGRVDAGETDPNNRADDVVADGDGDGLSDAEEARLGTDPADADSDDDGVRDGAEPDFAADSDGDGLVNPLDVDSDNDGLADGTELGVTTAGAGTDVARGHFVPDRDPSTRTSPVRADSDGGGVRDGNEDPTLDGRRDAGELDPLAAADDTPRPADSDGDGLSDAVEARLGTGVNDPDSDDDGVADGAEPNWSEDHDGDGLINPRDADSDNDLLFDGTELRVVTTGTGTDLAAGAFVADADQSTGTNPLRRDHDRGGVFDGAEDLDRNGRVDAGETNPNLRGDDGAPTDSDLDGLPNAVELALGSDPLDADSDDDGVGDGAEANLTWDADRDGLRSLLDADSDNDGLFDGTERGVTAPLADTRVAAGNFRADADGGVTRTNPLLRDTDRGGIRDGAEDLNGNGVVDSLETDPNNPADDVALPDGDSDGLSDLEEQVLGTDPADADSDDDGVADGAEPNLRGDADRDGLISPRDADSDNDGLFDGTELGVTAALPATDVGRGAFVADADPATRTQPQLADTDRGGVRDGAEDSNHNGRRDAGETDPNNRADDAAPADNDGDGLANAEELARGTDPNDADSDDDGLADGSEPNWGADNDGDGLINARDADSDNDRIFDGTEAGVVTPGPGTLIARGVFRADADPSTTTSPLLRDSDGGGIADGSEDIDRDGSVDAAPETDPNDFRDDTAPSDRDRDGLADAEELALGTSPDDADSDDDGVLDGTEPNLVADSDGDGLINPLDPDSDNDGLLDGTEVGLSQPLSPDTALGAGNFVGDADPASRTNPLDPDSDGGGVADGAEDPNHNGQVQAGEKNPRDRADDATPPADGDGDGLVDLEELTIGTSPTDADSDDDGVVDGDEPNFCCDTDHDGLGNALDADSDGDGVLDGTELGLTAAELGGGTDVTRGHFVADADEGTTTRMLVRDSDGGGVIDGLEDRDSDGKVDAGETDPLALGDDRITGDADGDTIYDVIEDVVDTDGDGERDFLDLDADGDHLADALEAGDAVLATPPVDSDGDRIANFRDRDSDADTVLDSDEAGDTDLATPARDRDGDGLADYLDLDSDMDSRSDAVEAGDAVLATPPVDTDGDGVPDTLDLDSDNDQVLDLLDNCPILANTDQADENRNGIGNLCEGDDDGDGVLEAMDNCPGVRNPEQKDLDLDGLGDACDPDANGDGLPDDLKVDGGCASAGGGSLALGLAFTILLLRRRRRRGPAGVATLGVLGLLLGVALGPRPVAAQPTVEARDFPVERFRWALDAQGVLGAESAAVPRHGSWGAALWLGYARGPLVLYADDGGGTRRLGELVSYRLSSELSGSLALWGRLQLGLAVPLVLSQDRDRMLAEVGPLPGISGTGLGDLRLTAKLGLLRGGRTEVAVSAAVTVPSSTGADYRGDDGATLAPELVVSRVLGQLRLAGNLGWKVRARTQLLDLVVDDELYAVLGAGYRLRRSLLAFDANLSLATAAADFLAKANQNQAELLGGASYDVPGPLLASLVGGVGLSDGVGTPQWRVLLAVRFGALASPAVDRDGDGVFGDSDQCPTAAEDRDGFQDRDGCPELDNDADGVADAEDGAPLDAEDEDGFQDRDGVPDLDNDGDGVLDPQDGCPNDRETENGIDDQDGCPDALPDTDGDGVRDVEDRCHAQPEDRDGFEDEDGCPDPDNDHDGVLDRVDRCVNDAGPAANAGCADVDGDNDGVVDRLDNCPRDKGQLRFKGCAARQLVAITAGKLELADAVYFRTDKAELERRSFRLLDNVAAVLRAHPEVEQLEIEGHTDNQGDDVHNKELSQHRAEAVAAYLTSKGVAAERLTATGYGEEQPIADNARSRGRAANRRVVFRIVTGPGVTPAPLSAPPAAPAAAPGSGAAGVIR